MSDKKASSGDKNRTPDNANNNNNKNNNNENDYENESSTQERMSTWSRKSEMEKTLSASIWGQPQLRPQEKRQFLGEFRERVLIYLTVEQVEENGTYPEVAQAIKDSRAHKLVLNKKVDLEAAREYIKLARKHRLQFTMVDSPSYSEETGLVVVSSRAEDVPHIEVPSRRQRLEEKGLPVSLIEAQGQKICPRCYETLQQLAPEETAHYRRQNFWDRLFQTSCPGHH